MQGSRLWSYNLPLCILVLRLCWLRPPQTLDRLPLTNPEHFGTPVIGKKGNRGRRSNPMWVSPSCLALHRMRSNTSSQDVCTVAISNRLHLTLSILTAVGMKDLAPISTSILPIKGPRGLEEQSPDPQSLRAAALACSGLFSISTAGSCWKMSLASNVCVWVGDTLVLGGVWSLYQGKRTVAGFLERGIIVAPFLL